MSTLVTQKKVLGAWYKDLLASHILLGDTAMLVYLALVKLFVQLATSNDYGFFRDELYFIDAGKHLAFGYVDFPAFIALLAAFTQFLFGNSLVAYHIFPAIAGTLVVFFTGLIARELGGGRFAQCLASLASLVSPTFLGIDSLFTMNAFDELWWVLACYVLILLIKREQTRYWLLFGLIAGIGLLTKMTMLMFGFAVIAGLLISSKRNFLLSKWLLIGGCIAALFLLPYVIWEFANNWTSLLYWSRYPSNIEHLPPIGFIYQQIITTNPVSLVIWLAGLYYYFFRPEGKPYRLFGYAFIILFLLFMYSHAKFYFLAPAYPVLFAAGALLLEPILTTSRWHWVKISYISSLVISGILLALFFLPVLPPSVYLQFSHGNDLAQPDFHSNPPQLPQPLADRFGWENMAASVAQVYHHLPTDQQNIACIFAGNYGEAGAIDYYSQTDQIPQSISSHLNYFIWGPGTCTGEIVISIGVPYKTLQPIFDKVVLANTVICKYCIHNEQNLPIYIAYHAKASIKDLWPATKNYDI